MATLTGAISIADLVDGLAGASIVGSNEVHTFIATPEGMITSTELAAYSNTYTVYVGTDVRTFNNTLGGTPGASTWRYSATPTVSPSGHDLTVNINSSTGALTLTDGSGSTGFADSDAIDSITITATILVNIAGTSTGTYTKVINLTKAKGGNARVTRMVPNKQTFEYARGASAVKDTAFSNSLELDSQFYNFTSTDADPVWTYQANDDSTATTISQSGSTTVHVVAGSSPATNQIGTYADSTAYTSGTRVYYATDGEVYRATAAIPNTNTVDPPANSNFTREDTVVATIHNTVSGGIITNSLLRVTPRQYQVALGTADAALRIAYTCSRTINSRAIGDTVGVIKIEDALGAYNINVLASGSTVFKNAAGTVDIRAELELSGTRRPSTDITSWQWQKEGVNLVVSAAAEWSSGTAYSANSTVQYETRLYTNAAAVAAGGAAPDTNTAWTAGNYALQVTQPSASGQYNYRPSGAAANIGSLTNQWPALRIGAADVTDDGADLFTCDITFSEI